MLDKKNVNEREIAWGISGSGDRLRETFKVIKKIKMDYGDEIKISVYLSKAGEQVVTYYKLMDELKDVFKNIQVEINSNTPFLAGALQLDKFEFLLIAPATSNTVAKISCGIADTLLSNAAIMALKAFVPVYLMPSDYEEGTITTILPNGKYLKLRVRKEDAENVKKISCIEDIFILKNPEEIHYVFKKHFVNK